jgi:hypothetical protein
MLRVAARGDYTAFTLAGVFIHLGADKLSDCIVYSKLFKTKPLFQTIFIIFGV